MDWYWLWLGFLFIFLLRWTWYPYFIPQYQEIATLVSALILSTLTLMLTGIPAALYERARSLEETDTTSALIWLAGAVLVTLPAIPNILRALGWAA